MHYTRSLCFPSELVPGKRPGTKHSSYTSQPSFGSGCGRNNVGFWWSIKWQHMKTQTQKNVTKDSNVKWTIQPLRWFILFFPHFICKYPLGDVILLCLPPTIHDFCSFSSISSFKPRTAHSNCGRNNTFRVAKYLQYPRQHHCASHWVAKQTNEKYIHSLFNWKTFFGLKLFAVYLR